MAITRLTAHFSCASDASDVQAKTKMGMFLMTPNVLRPLSLSNTNANFLLLRRPHAVNNVPRN